MTYTYHAYQRALERYDLNLTVANFNKIQRACISGEAPKMAVDDRGNSIHMFTYLGKRLIVLLSDEHNIISFMPPDYFNAGQKMKHRQKAHGAKQKMSIRHNALRREERRPNIGRIVAEALEDSLDG